MLVSKVLFAFEASENGAADGGAAGDEDATVAVAGCAVSDAEGPFRELGVTFSNGDVDWRALGDVFTQVAAVFA